MLRALDRGRPTFNFASPGFDDALLGRLTGALQKPRRPVALPELHRLGAGRTGFGQRAGISSAGKVIFRRSLPRISHAPNRPTAIVAHQ